MDLILCKFQSSFSYFQLHICRYTFELPCIPTTCISNVFQLHVFSINELFTIIFLKLIRNYMYFQCFSEISM